MQAQARDERQSPSIALVALPELVPHRIRADPVVARYQRSVRPQGLKRQLENRRERRLREGEEAALIQGCKTLDDGGMMLGRYYCAVDALLRRGEMLALQQTQLRIERVKGEPTYYLAVTAFTAKSRKAREVPVQSARLMQFLNERRFARYIFGQLDGSPISVSQFRTDWDKVMLAAGLLAGEYRTTLVSGRKREKHRDWFITKDSDLNWHDLRHEGASRMRQGVPLREIQNCSGIVRWRQRAVQTRDTGIVEPAPRGASWAFRTAVTGRLPPGHTRSTRRRRPSPRRAAPAPAIRRRPVPAGRSTAAS